MCCYRLRPLDATLARAHAQAIECTLHYIRVPDVDTAVGHEAAVALHEQVWGNPGLVARVNETGAKGGLSVTLFSKDKPNLTVNEVLVRSGLARIAKTHIRRVADDDKALVERLRAAQQEALDAHTGLFRYGEPGDSDDEDERRH